MRQAKRKSPRSGGQSNASPSTEDVHENVGDIADIGESAHEEEEHVKVGATGSPKRCKIDEEGFLTPATPDIPKSSIHYQSMNDEKRNQAISAETSEGCDSLFKSTILQSSEGDRSNFFSEPQQEQPELPSTDINVDPSVNVPKEKSSNFEHIFKGIINETTQFHRDWTPSFSESESFEMYSSTRLDKLIDKAKVLENSLIQQKEALREKLDFLSSSLRHMPI